MIPGSQTRHWWLVCCVFLFYSDVSANALQGNLLSLSLRKPTMTSQENPKTSLKNTVTRDSRTRRTCSTLVLTGSSTIPGVSERDVFDEFHRKNSGVGLTARYQASGDPRIQLFYEDTLQKWVIGMISERNTSVAIQWACTTTEPQDSHCGAHTSQYRHESVRWIFDPTLHLECGEGYKVGRTKRFFFGWLIFALVAVVVPSTVVAVQKEKGCLFYPSVCEKRDKIKDELMPQIQRLQNDLEKFGDKNHPYTDLPKVFKETKKHIETIRDMLSNIEILGGELKSKITSLTASYIAALEKLKGISLPQESVLEQYSSWLKSLDFDEIEQIVDISISLIPAFKTIPSVLNAASTLLLSITQIVSSLTDEWVIGKKLSTTISKMDRIIDDLQKQKHSIAEFKTVYQSQVIRTLKRFVRYIRADFPRFWKLLNKILHDKINMRNLVLVNGYLSKISNKIYKREMDMIQLVEQVVKYEQFDSLLKTMVQNGDSLDMIFKLSNQKRVDIGLNEFETKYNLLLFIANAFTNRSCYQGVDLKKIRSGQMGENDWSSFSVCFGPEMRDILELFKKGVANNLAPCRLFRQLKDKTFDNLFKVVRFVADYVLPNMSCYWGYDLTSIRKTDKHDHVGMFPVVNLNTVLIIREAAKRYTNESDIFARLCDMEKVCVQSQRFRDYLINFSCTGQCRNNQRKQNLRACEMVNFEDNYCY